MNKRLSRNDRWLLEMVRRDSNELWTLVNLLGQLQYRPVIPLLIRIYELMDGTEGRPDMRTYCLEKIGCVGGKKARAFLHDVLKNHKGHPSLGDWAIVGLCRWGTESKQDAETFLALLDDPKASVETKHSAVHGLANIATKRSWGDKYRLDEEIVTKMIHAAEFGLNHEHPEMRIAAIQLSYHLNAHRDRVEELARIDNRKGEVTKVSTEAKIILASWED
ncbi:MAG: hypothetical protein KF784_04115 [Fimbriimonadaceae bacterium]|nr:hypothetical protein [Fimbriimonadaceae bacterium]